MKKNRHWKQGFVLLVLYLVLLTYFLFFAEEMGRRPDPQAGYSYNLILFKEIRRFIVHRGVLGYKAVALNIVGNVVAFMPFGFILPEVWDQLNRWYTITCLGFIFSLCIELAQLVSRVGSFDVDDLLLNTIGAMVGYFVFVLAKGVWNKYRGENRK
ncbi:MAG: VanZ family protein [Lachnospiraceae bacterium]|nr:VanZ family protein [Lachnospiraceae bacterium]